MASLLARALSAAVRGKGLVIPVIEAKPNHSGGTDVPLQLEMSRWLKFRPWVPEESKRNKYGKREDLDNRLTARRDIMKRAIAKDGCKPGKASSPSSHSSSCDGTFRNEGCRHRSCSDLSRFKAHVEMLVSIKYVKYYKSEAQLYTTTYNALFNLIRLACRVVPKWSGAMPIVDDRLNEIKLNKPDFVIRNEKEEVVFALEIEHPRIKLRGAEETVKNTPEKIAEEYTKQFRKSVKDYEEGRDKTIKLDALQKAIIQTSFQALSVDRGLAVLSTLNDTVYFQAKPHVDSRGRITHIDVMTSKVYRGNPRNDELSTLESLFSFLMISTHADGVENMRETRRFLADAIDKENAEDEKNRGKDKKHESHGSSSQQPGSSSGHKASSSLANQRSGKKQKKKDKGAQRSFVSFLMSQLILENMRNLPNRFENVTRKERIGMLRSLGRGEYWCLNIVELEDMFMKHYYEVVGEGIIGTVLRADIGEFPVAIKVLNVNSEYEPIFECDPTPLDLLKNEVQVYKSLVERYPELIGKVVPRLYAVLEDEKDTTLVTEYVGDRLDRYRLNGENASNGPFEWYVNDERLSVKDQKQINEAATEALGKLNRRGVLHGDLREDNLRVQRITDEDGEQNWRVWWIDFSLTKIHEGESYEPFEWELGGDYSAAG